MMKAVRRNLRATFTSLGVRNFRLFFAGQIVSVSGTWMQMIGQSWLVLNLTGSPAALGIVTAAQFLPLLFFGPYAGVLADRYDKRKILLATQTVSLVLALVLGVIVASGVVQLWMVIALAGSLGISTAFDSPSRQSFFLEMVGPDKVANALTLNSVTMNVGRLFGPAIAGFVIAKWDLSVCFLSNGFSYIAAIIALLLIRPSELVPVPRAVRGKGQLREGLRFVWAEPALKVPLLLMLAIGTLTYEFSVTLPVLARGTFHVGASGFGLMQSVMSVGAIIGGLVLGTRAKPTPQRLVVVAGFFGLTVLALAATPNFTVALMVVPFVGAASILFMAMDNACLQLAASPEMRSRVMGLYAVAFLGSTPIGGPVIGFVAEHFGVRWAIAIGGATALIGALVAARALRVAERRTAVEPVSDDKDTLMGIGATV